VKLSVIIVNYNVKYFLEQCLISVFNSGKSIPMEVFVVDNNSVDGSVDMVREKFPQVNLIANNDNPGFSKANNQAIRISEGEYVLLLNPDTVVEGDTFTRCLDYMDEHPGAGALGVKMLDGKGKFLPESKRGLPTPAVAFYKIFGLSALFPKSKRFGRYHLGYLAENEINTVDVLPGAFMLIRKSALDKTGLLDEDFFMYGEDIDLSYRITRAGYSNIYFPDTRIIHYKGESTKKSSLNYVFVFYQAMVIFARKHFSAKSAQTFSVLINLAIYFRASLAVFNRMAQRILLPVTDFLIMYAGIFLIKEYWESSIIFKHGGHYPVEFIVIALPLYIIIWLFSVYLTGGYDRPHRLVKVFEGLLAGTVVILVIYSLLSEEYRFSRALILLGALWGYLSMTSLRIILSVMKVPGMQIEKNHNRRFAIIGNQEEAQRVAALVSKIQPRTAFIGLVSLDAQQPSAEGFIGDYSNIRDLISIYSIDEIIFCAKDIPARQIIDLMSELQDQILDFRIVPAESSFVIGSNFISASGDPYTFDLNSIGKISNLRNKRFFDVVSASVILMISPFLLIWKKTGFTIFTASFSVLTGRKTWVGYAETHNQHNLKLPDIKKGIFSPQKAFDLEITDPETLERLNSLYARDYRVGNDLNILLKGIRKL